MTFIHTWWCKAPQPTLWSYCVLSFGSRGASQSPYKNPELSVLPNACVTLFPWECLWASCTRLELPVDNVPRNLILATFCEHWLSTVKLWELILKPNLASVTGNFMANICWNDGFDCKCPQDFLVSPRMRQYRAEYSETLQMTAQISAMEHSFIFFFFIEKTCIGLLMGDQWVALVSCAVSQKRILPSSGF